MAFAHKSDVCCFLSLVSGLVFIGENTSVLIKSLFDFPDDFCSVLSVCNVAGWCLVNVTFTFFSARFNKFSKWPTEDRSQYGGSSRGLISIVVWWPCLNVFGKYIYRPIYNGSTLNPYWDRSVCLSSSSVCTADKRCKIGLCACPTIVK